MARKRHKPEEIVAKLPQVEVLTAQGKSVAGGDPVDRGDGSHVLPLAERVRRAEGRPGAPTEGVRG